MTAVEQVYTLYGGIDAVPGSTAGAGKDGISATHSWNGTVLTITSASGTSSADLRGPAGPQGDPGPAYTLTDEDKTSITNSVLASLPTWNGGDY